MKRNNYYCEIKSNKFMYNNIIYVQQNYISQQKNTKIKKIKN